MTSPKALGQRVKGLRKARQLTLVQLSDISGVAVSTISKIENGALSPTLDKILRLASGLKLTIGQLIGEENLGNEKATPNSRFQPARMADGVKIDTPNYEYNYLCSELVNKRLVPIRAMIKASSIQEFGPLERHSGEEFLFVLEGEIEVHSEFYAPLSLSKGEGVYLDSSMGHAYVRKSETKAEIICICTERQNLSLQNVNSEPDVA